MVLFALDVVYENGILVGLERFVGNALEVNAGLESVMTDFMNFCEI